MTRISLLFILSTHFYMKIIGQAKLLYNIIFTYIFIQRKTNVSKTLTLQNNVQDYPRVKIFENIIVTMTLLPSYSLLLHST